MYSNPIYMETMGNQKFLFSTFWPITEYKFIISGTATLSYIGNNNVKSIQYFEKSKSPETNIFFISNTILGINSTLYHYLGYALKTPYNIFISKLRT